MPTFTLNRLLLAVPILGVGVAVLIKGASLEMQNPRTNHEDDIAWAVLALGASLIGVGVGLLSRHRLAPLIFAVAFPPLGFLMLSMLYWWLLIGYSTYKNWGHQEFAKNGVAQIEPAWQMNQLFGDCRHFITYADGGSVSEWNSVAFFGGRYELIMQVPVEIESSTSGEIIGEPQFSLNEVSNVSLLPHGQISVTYSTSRDFGLAEWKLVYAAGGDFGKIGFKINTGPPIKDFDVYAKSSR